MLRDLYSGTIVNNRSCIIIDMTINSSSLVIRTNEERVYRYSFTIFADCLFIISQCFVDISLSRVWFRVTWIESDKLIIILEYDTFVFFCNSQKTENTKVCCLMTRIKLYRLMIIGQSLVSFIKHTVCFSSRIICCCKMRIEFYSVIIIHDHILCLACIIIGVSQLCISS